MIRRQLTPWKLLTARPLLATGKIANSQLRFYSPRKLNRGGFNKRDYQERPWNPYEEAERLYQQQQYQREYQEPIQQQYYYEQPSNSPYDITYQPNLPDADGWIKYSDGISQILSQPCLVMERKIEFMNLFLGFEQANRYAIMDIAGNHLGYMEEEDFTIGKAIMRQIYRLHRPFSVRVLDRMGQHVLTIRRPFSFINSHIKAIIPGEEDEKGNPLVVGESIQQWHLWRRRYNLYLNQGEDVYNQFGYIDAPFLSFSFGVQNEEERLMGGVDRNWVGLGRELFTDTGVYIIRMDPTTYAMDPTTGFGMDSSALCDKPMNLDQRAVLLATAVSIDFDYFSRHSGSGGFFSFGSYE